MSGSMRLAYARLRGEGTHWGQGRVPVSNLGVKGGGYRVSPAWASVAVKPKKKNYCKAFLLRRTFKGTNTTFLFSLSLSIYLLQYEDLAQPEMRTLCERVGTLNV